MDVFLVRHGQTDGNVAFRHQHVDTELNEVGKLQADRVGRFLAKKRPTHIITSTNLRAVETAKKIAEHCRLVPETLPVFEEFSTPKRLAGNFLTSKVSLIFMFKWFYGKEKEKSGESYTEFLGRILSARKTLEEMPENSRVVVVSHSVYINFFLEHLCRDKKITSLGAIKNLYKILKTNNTDVFHLKFIKTDVRKGGCGWKLLEKIKRVKGIKAEKNIKEIKNEWDFLEEVEK